MFSSGTTLLISIIVLCISIKLFKYSVGTFNLSRLNMISVLFYRDFMLLTFVGVVMVATKVDIKNGIYFWAITGQVSDTSRFYGWVTVMYALMLFPVGMILSNLVFLDKLSASKNVFSYYKKKSSTILSRNDNAVFFSLVLFLIVCSAAVIYVFKSIGHVPVLTVLKGDTTESIGQIRSNAKIHFNGISAIKDVVAINLSILLSYILFVYSKINKHIKYKILFLYSLMLDIIMTTYNLEKITLFYYLFGFMLLTIMIKSKIKLKGVIVFGVIVFSLLILIFYLFYGKGLLDTLKDILIRIFAAETSAIFLSYEYIPNVHDFIGVKGTSNFVASLLNTEKVMYGRLLFEIYNPVAVENNTAGFIVGLFTTEAWMLFGLPGVLLAPVYVGFFIQSVHIFLVRLPKTPILMGFYVYTCMKWSLTGGISQIIFPIVFFTTLGILSFIFITSIILKGSKE